MKEGSFSLEIESWALASDSLTSCPEAPWRSEELGSKSSVTDVSKGGSKVLEISTSDSPLVSQSEGSWRFEELKLWTGDGHEDFRKGNSSVLEERSILKVLGERCFLGRKESGSSILGFRCQILP